MSNARKELKERIQAIEEEIRKAKRAKDKLLIDCAHQSKKGKLKLINISGDMYKCKFCDVKFSLQPVSQAKLEDAIKVLHNVIQQIRSFSDQEKDVKLIRHLGEIDFNLTELPDIYSAIMSQYKKDSKDRKDDDDDIGFTGLRSLSFVDKK